MLLVYMLGLDYNLGLFFFMVLFEKRKITCFSHSNQIVTKFSIQFVED